MVDLRNYDANTCASTINDLKGLFDETSLHEMADWVLDQALTIQAIPAPTFHEADRMAHVEAIFQAHDLADVSTDDRFNVFGRLPGKQSGPGVMVVAHTDTVFPFETDLKTRREPDRIYGPGLGDNSLGVAAMLGVLHMLKQKGLTPERDMHFVATSREEGLGDLGGMRAAFDQLKDHIYAIVNLEGIAFAHIYHEGIAVRRLHITAHTEGGHSWAHFGNESAIHNIVKLGAQITALKPPDKPRTTYNIGLIDGGQSINTIAATAGMWLDLRSEQRDAVLEIENHVRNAISSLGSHGVRFEVEVVGDRPSGGIAIGHPLVQLASDAVRSTGHAPTLATGSTDGNISLAAGYPTVTMGVTSGGHAHRLDEYIEIAPIKHGFKHILLTALAACEITRQTA